MNEIAIYPSLKNKVVLITGGAQGIGESIVEQFIKQESKVAFLDIDEKAAENLVKKISLEYKKTPLFIKCDLKDIDQLKNSISLVREKLGSISVLVNNAANDERHDIDSVTPEFWDDRMNIIHLYLPDYAEILCFPLLELLRLLPLRCRDPEVLLSVLRFPDLWVPD